MALIARSSEISFSLSRLRSTFRSMSIASRSQLRLRVPEFHLDGSRAERGVTETAAGPLDVQGHLFRVGGHDPAGHGTRIGDRDPDQAPDRAPPVPRVGQRAVNTRGGDFERIR